MEPDGPPGGASDDRSGRAARIRLNNYTLLVRDQDRSLRFYVDTLGFRLVADTTFGTGTRWVAVAPPDGTAMLALVAVSPGSADEQRVGEFTQVVFLAEDVEATFREWSRRGVRFHHPPSAPAWGGAYTSFEDVDGNSFAIVGFDEASRRLEAERREAEEKREAERRSAQELEIAREVQARLFPQTVPVLRSLDYAGVCLQARQVGGDYYDFLSLAPGRLGLVVGDISGKGIGAALLMTYLQANLRGQCAAASDRPDVFLRSVNRLFCENTPESAYATLMFADYDDASGCLRYAGCGHPAALLLRRDGRVERLPSTGPALGLFLDWECSLGETRMEPGDTLALYSDGVTESFSEGGEEFGEERLVSALRAQRRSSAQATASRIADEVARFSPADERDDVTLIVARVRG
jgi:serine phosphatase RsbU (regulator of sigma subunit)/predicted enzyme related to lactoylglutathione lyase